MLTQIYVTTWRHYSLGHNELKSSKSIFLHTLHPSLSSFIHNHLDLNPCHLDHDDQSLGHHVASWWRVYNDNIDQHIPLDIGQVKLPVRQMDFGIILFWIVYYMFWKMQIQCSAIITRSIISRILTIDTHSLPVRARYGVSVVILISDSLSATVIAVSYVILG